MNREGAKSAKKIGSLNGRPIDPAQLRGNWMEILLYFLRALRAFEVARIRLRPNCGCEYFCILN
jgi:hypothetical protein